MDFFAGSCVTAHAVLELNKKDGGNRKFIMVQLPEPCDEKSEAFKAGYKTIADIGKERIRRVIKKIEEERAAKEKEQQSQLFCTGDSRIARTLDLGFKVLKLDKSNFKPWEKLDADASEEKIAKQLEMFVNHIDPNSSQEDILYEILLKAGFSPAEKVEKLEMAGKTVFSIADGLLLICLEDEITRELIDAVCDAEPLQFICLDQGFKGNDQLKTNAVQTFAARNQGRDKANQIVFRTV
ncbi:MAG: site-specific DNA-methyltransferase [Deltaproteobacteria bacterium]|nr:site-specific DNA-methyltransferase [Deltaproteobacteria bacterium]